MIGLPFKEIAAAALEHSEVLVPSWLPEGKRQGDEWKARNPRRDDQKLGSFSISLKTGIWKDFASGDRGSDLVSLYAFLFTNGNQGDAVHVVAREVGFDLHKPTGNPKKPSAPRPASGVPPKAPAPPVAHYELGEHTAEWIYRNYTGVEISRVRRYDTPEGKQYRPLTFKDGKWTWNYPSEPRPLYGLDCLADENKTTVLIVEGEKAADAAAKLLPSMAVVTSPAGAKSVAKADWTPLRGRDAVIWPDNDQAGLEYAGEVHALLKALGIKTFVVDIRKDWPKKWDLADSLPHGVNPATIQEMIAQARPWAVENEKAPDRRLDCIRWKEMRGKPIPPPEYDWEPFLARVAFGIIASAPGHGKSILVVQIAVAKAAGLPLFGYPTGEPRGVGIVALEDDPNVLHRRTNAAVDSYGDTFTEEHHRLLDANLRVLVRSRNPLAYLTPQTLDLALVGLVEEIGNEMETTEAKPALCFLDTLNAVHGGDENSSQETRPLVSAIFGLHARLGCSVWALHHLRKSGAGRNAPSFMDRMDPELLRGSSALVGAARAVLQFGWINPTEAAKASLEPDGATRRYAVMGLTKVNDGPPSPWVLLEHTPNAGMWVPAGNGDQILAGLRGGRASADLSKAEEFLLDVHRGLKHKELAEKHYPDDEKAADKVKSQLSALRNRHGWLQKGSLALTAKGFDKVQEIGRRASEGVDPLVDENEQSRASA